MSSSTAQEYIELFGDDRQARLALLTCSAALRLDDETAHAAIELVAQSNGSTEGLLRRVKNLGCVWREWNGYWYVAEDVRPHLLNRLHEDVPEATLVSLRERLAASADSRAEWLPPDGQVTSHDKLLSKFEAAYQRVLIPEKSEEGAAQLAELWQHSPPAAARATAQSVDYLADEFNRRLPRLPDEVLFLRGMAARSRGDRVSQEKYFRQVWERGRRGYIYAIAAHLFGLLVQGRNRKTAEHALRDSIRWNDSRYQRGQVHHSLGNLLARDRRRWPEAEQAYRQSIDLLEASGDKGQVYHSLGNLLARDRRRWPEAEQAYKQSLDLDEVDRSRAQTMHSLGNLLTKERRWPEAEQAYRQSIELAQDDYSRAQTMHSLGKLLFKIPSRRDEAESTLEQSLRSRDAPDDQVQVLGTWAAALSELNDVESNSRAEEYALRGIEIATGNLKSRGVLYRVLAHVYERRGDYPKAIEACKAWKEADQKLHDWKFVKEAQAKIDELSRKMKGGRKSKRKKSQNKRREQQVREE